MNKKHLTESREECTGTEGGLSKTVANGTRVSRIHGRVAWNVLERIKHLRSSNVMQGRTYQNVGPAMQMCNGNQDLWGQILVTRVWPSKAW